jgi:prepilin-type N-terminal cleavage/methylation domain-containing protein
MILVPETDTMHAARIHRSQSGMSLLETMIALTVLLIVTVGVMSLATISVETTENQGHLQSRVTEYAQDKMEQLVGLGYGDGDPPATSGTDTTVFPACSPQTVSPPACTTGTGLKAGGSSDPANPVSTPGNGYVDYLDSAGNLTTATSTTDPWYYIRVWKIELPAGTTNLKRITVTAQVRATVGGTGSGAGALPTSTVVSLKTYPF